MAKAGSMLAQGAERRKEGLFHGLLVSVLGGMWLAQEMGIINAEVPIGPIAIIVIGFLTILSSLNR